MQELSGEISKKSGARLLEYFSSRRDVILARVRELVETESPSGHESGSCSVVDILVEAGKDIPGVDSIERIKSPGYGEHLQVRAFTKSASSSGTIFMLGHTDTVHPLGSLVERPWRVDGNRAFGPGIFDMKASCALAFEAIRACSTLDLRPNREVVLLLTCDEETGSETGRLLVESQAARAACALVLEPPATGGRVKTGRKGTGIFAMEIDGVAAHAGLEPEKGASAILELARQVERLHSMNDFESGINVSVGVVSGGTRTNVIAAHARADIDLRFDTLEDGKRIENEIQKSQPFDERTRLQITGGINRPPLERNERVITLYQHAKKNAAILGFELGEAQVGGASDGNFVAAMGVPVLDGLGIDGDGAHAAHEHIVIDDIVRRGALLCSLIATL